MHGPRRVQFSHDVLRGFPMMRLLIGVAIAQRVDLDDNTWGLFCHSLQTQGQLCQGFLDHSQLQQDLVESWLVAPLSRHSGGGLPHPPCSAQLAQKASQPDLATWHLHQLRPAPLAPPHGNTVKAKALLSRSLCQVPRVRCLSLKNQLHCHCERHEAAEGAQ